MKGFPGFPDGKLKTMAVPRLFFSDLLPIVDHMGELKVTLYAFWALTHKEGKVRYLRLVDFLHDQAFMAGMGDTPTVAAEYLLDSLERAVARGTFLHINVEGADGTMELYFVNTERGRAAVDGILSGDWRPGWTDEDPVTLLLERPNIFVLYEQNIGPLTPLLAEQLRDAERTYSQAWIKDAIEAAVANNVRKWRYVLAVLQRWQQEGKRDEVERRDTKQDSAKRIPDEYEGVIKR